MDTHAKETLVKVSVLHVKDAASRTRDPEQSVHSVARKQHRLEDAESMQHRQSDGLELCFEVFAVSVGS